MPKQPLSENDITDLAEIVAAIAITRGKQFDAKGVVVRYGQAAIRDPLFMAAARELVSEIRLRRWHEPARAALTCTVEAALRDAGKELRDDPRGRPDQAAGATAAPT